MPSNYTTRPNKHVDREIFADLVGCAISNTPIDRCGYLSMGGPQMADHFAMYKRNGITKLYSFDLDENVVARQRFNSPTELTFCAAHAASELPAKIDEISENLDVERLVVWLDYTGAHERGAQLAEFQALLQSLSVGDLARISMDASLPPEKRKSELPEELRVQEQHFPAMNALLARELGELHPEFDIESLGDMPRYLSACVQHLCDRAALAMPAGNIRYFPVLQTYYIDSVPMFTATVLVQDTEGVPPAPNGFCYLAGNWDDIEYLEVPELTAREKSFLDRLLDKDGPTDELGYPIARNAQIPRQWASFKKYHRFLPQFQHVDVK